MDLETRFWSKVNKDGPMPASDSLAAGLGPCWLWTRPLTADGYGQFWIKPTTVRAHQASYVLHNGPVPKGLELDHLCERPSCVNPTHLEAVTHQENTKRRDAQEGKGIGYRTRSMTHCRKGHPFSPENTRLDRRNSRICLSCERARMDRRNRKRSPGSRSPVTNA